MPHRPEPGSSRGDTVSSRSAEADSVVRLVGAGDIAGCRTPGDEATARVLDRLPKAIVFTLGDNAYPHGTWENFARCYDPSWGRHKARTRPALGNHDHRAARAAPYFEYFGKNAGPFGQGYYAYDAGAWRVLVLDSHRSMHFLSPQERWLRRELARHARRCVLAYWHIPRFSSGRSRHSPTAGAVWRALSEAGADLVLGAHDHHYERFARQSVNGRPDSAHGIRQFVAGTGGYELQPVAHRSPNSEIVIDSIHGVLELTLRPDRYDWRFLAVDGTVADSGTDRCH